MDVDALLTLDNSIQGILVKKSKIPRSDAGLGFLASRTFLKSTVVRFYCSSLVYASLTEEQHKKKMYSKGVMQVTVESFR